MLVYGVYKNSDMIEGRGPMVLDRIFLREDAAMEYADKQPGVMGRRNLGSWFDKNVFPYGGDWTIRTMVVIE